MFSSIHFRKNENIPSLDIAVNKIASQSSIKHNGFPSRAVDGNFNFQWEKGSCMHTNEEQDPWWRVDLGREYIITGNISFISSNI